MSKVDASVPSSSNLMIENDSPRSVSSKASADLPVGVPDSVHNASAKNNKTEGESPIFRFNDDTNGFNLFCDEVLNVNKSVVGSDNDPTYELLWAAAKHASELFWGSALKPENKDHLENLVKRCRNWISVLTRKNAHLKTLPALRVLRLLPLNDTMVKQIGIPMTVNNLSTSTDLTEVLDAANALKCKYSEAFQSAQESAFPLQSPAKPASAQPKLFSEIGALKLRTYKRVRENSPPAQPESQPSEESSRQNAPGPWDANEDDSDDQPVRKRAKTSKKVHWKPDSDLVQVRFFEMDGIAKFKSAKNARQQEHDEGSAMHPSIDWLPPRSIDFANVFANEQLRSLMSTRRGGTKEPVSEEAKIQEVRESLVSKSNEVADSPKEPPLNETAADPSWKPKEGGKFVAATPSREWLQKHPSIKPAMGSPLNPSMNPVMNNMVPQMMPQLMPTFPWGMNYPMNMNMNMNMNMGMGMTPAQMSEMMRMNSNAFGSKQ